MKEKNNTQRAYKSYDYLDLSLNASRASQYIDSYANFGWVPDDNYGEIKEQGNVHLRMKRERKIMNKVELTRLQRHLEDCLRQIEALERSRTSKPTVYALVVAFIGTAFMAGSVFAVTHEPPIIWLCVLLAIPGIIGWILPYFVYNRTLHQKNEEVDRLIETKYDEIDAICEKGSSLI